MLAFGIRDGKLEKVAVPPTLPKSRMATISLKVSSASPNYLIFILDPSRPRPLPAQERYRSLSGEHHKALYVGSPVSSGDLPLSPQCWCFKYMLPHEVFMWAVGIQTQAPMLMLKPFTTGGPYPPLTCFFIRWRQN